MKSMRIARQHWLSKHASEFNAIGGTAIKHRIILSTQWLKSMKAHHKYQERLKEKKKHQKKFGKEKEWCGVVESEWKALARGVAIGL